MGLPGEKPGHGLPAPGKAVQVRLRDTSHAVVKPMHVFLKHVPWFSQFDAVNVERAGNTACYRACRAMCAASGVTIPVSTEKRIQVALRETEDGVAVDPVGAAAARAHLVQELNGGRPVVAGVHYKAGSLNRDGITDHYMVLVGMEAADGGAGLVLFGLDPGRRILEGAAHNTVLTEHQDGALVRTSPEWPRMVVSMLVPSVESLWKPSAG